MPPCRLFSVVSVFSVSSALNLFFRICVHLRSSLFTALASCLLVLGLGVGALGAGRPAATTVQAVQAVQSPFVVVFDAGKSLGAEARGDLLMTRAGWKEVPEGSTSHAFVGDAVILNNRTAAVFRRGAARAELFWNTDGGWRFRAAVGPLGADGAALGDMAKLRLIENTPGGSTVEAAFAGKAADEAALRFRLTAGAALVEVSPSKGSAGMSVTADHRCAVVPDLLAEDAVFGSEAPASGGQVLPAENMLLSLSGRGDSILVLVWPSPDVLVDRSLAGYGIRCKEGQNIWLAALAAPGIWHARTVAADEAGKEIALDWRPPFAAKWRCSLVDSRGGLAQSWLLAEEPASASPAPTPAGTAPATPGPPGGKVPLPREGSVSAGPTASAPASGPSGRTLVIYPIDRSRATPLTVFCPIDIMRNALGVGVCQYILDMEGLLAEGDATCDTVATWAERQFAAAATAGAAAAAAKTVQAQQLAERLGQMVRHVELTDTRIREYRVFSQALRATCAAQEGLSGPGRTASDQTAAILDELQQRLAEHRQMEATEKARRLAAELAALAGKPDPMPECRRLTAELRAIGSAQDAALARCRMALRRIRAACQTASDSGAAGFADGVRKQVDRMLRRK